MAERPVVRCAIYTRKSTDEGLTQDFNSLDAQREAAEAYAKSQVAEGWACLPDRYDDGGFTGANMERPALKRLLAEVEAGGIDIVLTYKVDRLSRSLADFTRLMELFERHSVAYVSITQRIDTSTSMGRLMMNVLQSFAQFERELVSERTRDKIASSRRRGMWTGGRPILGYDVDRSGGSPKLAVNQDEAIKVRQIFELYLEHGSLMPVVAVLNERGWRTKSRTTKAGRDVGGQAFDKGKLFSLLTNPTYIGKVKYRDEIHDGEHEAIVPHELWQRVQARLQRNGRSGGAEARNKHGALLRGLLHCGPCGCSMVHAYTQKRGRRYRYYVCLHAQKRGWHTCPSKSVPAGEVERYVVEQIRCVGRDPAVVAETLAAATRQAEEQVERLKAEDGVLTRQLKRDEATLRRARDPGHQADLHERIGAAQRRLAEIRQEIEALRDGMVGAEEARAALARFEPVWETLSPGEQVRLLQLLVERVVYDGAAGTVAITFRPTGIRALEAQVAAEAAA